MKKANILLLCGLSFLVAGCATKYSAADLEKMAKDAVNRSFSERGIAKKDRINQDPINEACSKAEYAGTPLSGEITRKLEAAQAATIKYPSDGKFLGDWKAGERLAQDGRGSTYSDKAGSANGGNCYNCHQISKEEISHGTLGPSLYNYGKLRGDSPEVVKYTWGKIYNAKAFNACTNMPRFGHQGILTEEQIKDLVALLLDPNSPVNK
ncbi:MAG: sulfur oxidation c-type cytochrome SoxX [Burkholderiaceae bacterium]|nr:sulfur oxidation c-type cytochrome SoxX [Burkholderiaceae bacterium]